VPEEKGFAYFEKPEKKPVIMLIFLDVNANNWYKLGLDKSTDFSLSF